MGGDQKPQLCPVEKFVANRDPELATAWTKHKAITNYENHHNINVDMSRNYVTPIEVVANSSLGIDGWALCDVGSAEPSGGGDTAGSSDAEASSPARGKYRADKFWISQGGALANLEDGDSSDWDSERDLTDLEPMESPTDSEIDGENGDWTEVRHRKWGGNAGYSIA